MKQKNFLKIAVLFFVAFFSLNLSSQTTLSAGDVAITSFNSDDNDEFSFILLKDIVTGTEVYFTENGWDDDANGGGAAPTWGNTGEGSLLWTSTSPMSAGTQVQIILPRANATLDVNTGNISKSGTWSLSSTSDAIIIYQGTGFPNDGNEVTSFIWAFDTGATGFESNATATSRTGIPTGLTNGVNAIDFESSDDNYLYNCSTNNASDISALRTALVTEANFTTGVDSENYQAPTACFGISTWLGTTSDWATATNWFNGVIPNNLSNVDIPELAIAPIIATTTDANAGNLTISEADGLTISSGGTLIISGTANGNVNYNRTLANAGQWYYMSSPVINETYNTTWATANLVATSSLNTDNIGVSTYDNTSLDSDTDAGGPDTATDYWRYLQSNNSNSDNFNVGQGYGIILSAPTTISFSGTGIYNTTQTYEITQNASNFNLVGNPFTAFLNLGDFFGDNDNTIITGASTYFWNGSGYDTRTSGLNGSYEIAPGQGFFVEAAVANANVTFDAGDVTHQPAETFQKNIRQEIHLFVSDGKNNKYANIYYIEGKTKGYDNGFEGKLFGGVSHSFALFTQLLENNRGDKYQLQSLPNLDYENMVVPIGLIADAGKEITFTSESLNLPSDIKVFLEDREAKKLTRLDEANSEYTITLTEKADGIGRFYLHTKSSAVLNTETVNLENISIYKSNDSTLRITGLSQGKTSVTIFNILGKQILDTTFTSNGVKEITLPNVATGVYIIQLTTENGSLSKKITLE